MELVGIVLSLVFGGLGVWWWLRPKPPRPVEHMSCCFGYKCTQIPPNGMAQARGRWNGSYHYLTVKLKNNGSLTKIRCVSLAMISDNGTLWSVLVGKAGEPLDDFLIENEEKTYQFLLAPEDWDEVHSFLEKASEVNHHHDLEPVAKIPVTGLPITILQDEPPEVPVLRVETTTGSLYQAPLPRTFVRTILGMSKETQAV